MSMTFISFAVSFGSLLKHQITLAAIFKPLYLIWLSLALNSSYCFVLNMRSCGLTCVTEHVMFQPILLYAEVSDTSSRKTKLYYSSVYFSSFCHYQIHTIVHHFLCGPLFLSFRMAWFLVQCGYLLQMEWHDFSSHCQLFLPLLAFHFPWKIYSCKATKCLKDLIHGPSSLQMVLATVELSTSIVVEAPSCARAQVFEAVLLSQISEISLIISQISSVCVSASYRTQPICVPGTQNVVVEFFFALEKDGLWSVILLLFCKFQLKSVVFQVSPALTAMHSTAPNSIFYPLYLL